MSHDYSEDKLIEQTCMQLFDSLQWQTMNVLKGEAFGTGSTLGRSSEADVLLKDKVYHAFRILNPNLPQQAYDAAWEELNADPAAKPLPELNHEKYKYLIDGIPVTYKNDKGEIVKNKKIKVLNLDEPEQNDYLAVQQLWVEGKSKRRKRPDIVGFVNGIPLLFIELKAHHRKLKVAYEQNLRDYKQTIPRLFQYNAFIILSNGIESKIGAVTSEYEHFHDWKRIEENAEGIISLETIIKGVCDKQRFLDLFENFILYDTSIGSVIKLIARNHQFIGVNKAVEHLQVQQNRLAHGLIDAETAQRLGVFWHTQGSGKSYSMVFLCQKINRKLGGAYTFLLVTDRVELDKQIYGTFAGVGAVKDDKTRADSGTDLKALLKTDEKYIFTLIHKFNFNETITERRNIIVISDEAHRTQGGTMAMNMRKALPNASFIGFTGTPLFKDDELTRRIFGDYVSVYDFKRSIEDGATVPLYYENRGEKLKLENPKINEEIREAIEAADMDSDQEDKLKRLFAKDYPILTAKKRLRAIAKDVVEHFNTRGYKGKGMLVTLDKITAVRMYNYIKEEWEAWLEKRKAEIDKITDEQEQLNELKNWQWSKDTEMAVIISHEQNEIDKFAAWGLDIEEHRLKMNTRDLETEFKDESNPFRFAVVCAKWITGFDVKSLSTLYLDKPLKSHTLMQTIARANRVHEGKNNGLIVDYIETYKALLEALAIYAVGGDKKPTDDPEAPVKPLEELIANLQEVIDTTVSFLKDEVQFDIDTIINSKGLERIAAISKGVDAVYTNDETKNKYGVLSREVFKKYKALMPNSAIYDFKAHRDAINAIYAVIADNKDEADITSIIKRVQDVVDNSIESLNILMEPVEGYGNKVDLSGLDFDLIQKEFLKLEGKQHVAVQSLKDKVEQKLNKMLAQNPYRIDFHERYQKIIEDYNNGKEYKAIKEIFDQLLNFYKDLDEEGKRSHRENLAEDELAVFDMLGRDKKITDKEKNSLKETAKQLLARLKDNEFRVGQWADKPQTASAVRVAIQNYLFETLPYPTYQDEDINIKTDILFNFFKTQYGGYGGYAA